MDRQKNILVMTISRISDSEIQQILYEISLSIPLDLKTPLDPDEFEQDVVLNLPLDILKNLKLTNYLIKAALKERVKVINLLTLEKPTLTIRRG